MDAVESTADDDVRNAVLAVRRRNRKRRRVVVTSAVVAATAATAGIGVLLSSGWGDHEPLTVITPSASGTATATPTATPTPTPTVMPTPTATPRTTPTESAESTRGAEPTQPAQPTETPDGRGTSGGSSGDSSVVSDPHSLTVLVNKHNKLPKGFTPNDLVSLRSMGVPSANDHSLRQDAASAAAEMYEGAADAGHQLDFASGYRSYETQQRLYRGYVETLGKSAAQATSARPGYSEHQTGLAVDILDSEDSSCAFSACFGRSNAGRWLNENSWRYGFILRYPSGYSDVHGFEYEPWHFRYVGVETAKAYYESGAATYEEFLDEPAAPDYE